MERTEDKCLMLLACLALVALAGEVSAAATAAVTGAACESAAFELLEGRKPRAAAVLCCLSCMLLAAAPGTWIALPLVAYDLPRLRWRWLWALAPILALCPLALGAVAFPQAFVLLAFITLSVALSRRSSQELSFAVKLHSVEDELSDKVLALSRKMRELEEARVSEAHAAALAERTRIAREIHDSVGHTITRLLLEVEALKVVHRDDAGASEELAELSSGLNDAMSSMRKSVHALDDSSLDLAAELRRLGSESGIPRVSVVCDIEDAPSAATIRCLAGIAREALTNAARHAHAETASIRVAELPGIWQLKVENDGDMPRSMQGLEERGMGLRGMRERTESLDGTFLATADGKRFTVFASIPRARTA